MRSKSYIFLIIVIILGLGIGIWLFQAQTTLRAGHQGRLAAHLSDGPAQGHRRAKEVPRVDPKPGDLDPYKPSHRAARSHRADHRRKRHRPDHRRASGSNQHGTGRGGNGLQRPRRVPLGEDCGDGVRPNRPYIAVDDKDTGAVGVNFQEKITGKLIKPSDPEYADIIKGWDPILAGDELTSAEPENVGGNYDPSLHFSPAGAKKMDEWSRAHVNKREMLASVLDGKVLSIAGVKDNTVLSDNAVIEGKFPDGYVTNLCNLLNSGALPVSLNLLGSQSLDPTLGALALQKIEVAGVIAFGIIAVFLIGYYAFPGFVAVVALSLYVLFTLTVLELIGATFSLAGIAGFILSVGMAVDANILVFERFKEEIRGGKALPSALELGFKRALSAIFDSNACTVITSLVLVDLGTGPVKGFATTLIIGVLVSLFTAVAVTRSLLKFFVDSGIAVNPKLFAVDRNWFQAEKRGESLQVVQKSTRWFLISGITIVISIPFFFLHGFRPNVELQGGSQFTYAVSNSSQSADAIQHNLEAGGYRGGNVQFASIEAKGGIPARS